MFALIMGAVRTRRAQVLTVLVLTALAAAAGPWFAAAGQARAAVAAVAASPAAQRTLSVREVTSTGGDPAGAMDTFGGTVRGLLPLPASQPVNGLVLALTVTHGADTSATALAYRDDACAHLRLDGRCPSGAQEAAVSQSMAQQLGLSLGGTLTLRGTPSTDPVNVKIVGRYTRDDPTGPYWSNPLFQAASGGLDPVFTPVDTFELRQLWEPTVSYDVRVPDALIRGDGGYRLAAVLKTADARLSAERLRLVNATGGLLDTIARDRATIRRGVLVSMIGILVLAWFAIGLAGRYTGRDRRGDAALLKLRGSTRLGMLRLAWGQHLVPLVLGVLAGAPLGYLVARALGGQVPDPAAQRDALLLSLAAAGAVLLGGLVSLALVEALVLRLPVATLLRQVTFGRGDWRSALIDLLLLAIAVSAVYQGRSGGPDSGLALAAPALVALAVALLLARLLGRVADRGGGAAVRAGRLRLGLTAVQVSRQPGSDRVFALVVVAVAMFGTALGGWQAERTTRTDRGAAELGADRVLTVQAANRTALLNAVRGADPQGREAMAAVLDRGGVPATLAVDSSRLAAVAHWRPEYGPVGALPAATADAPGPEPLPAVTGNRLTVRFRHDGTGKAALTLVLQNDDTGVPARVSFGTLRAGERTAEAPVAGCTGGAGCRILRWELTSPPAPNGQTGPPPGGTTVTVRGLTQQDPAAVILDPPRLGDITRWRPGTAGAALDVAAGHGTLRLSADPNTGATPPIGDQAYAVQTALPLPIVLAGAVPSAWEFGDPQVNVFGIDPVPVRLAGQEQALPVLGTQGVLVDLDAVRRLTGDADPAGQFQVWLAAGAGPQVVERLTAAGLTVVADDSVAARSAQLAEQGPPVVARFALLAGVAGLLLAAATVAVAATVDRRSRLEQLRALRVQGLSGRTAVVIGQAGTAALIGAGLLGGVLAAALADRLAAVRVPPFTDGWHVLPPPAALGGAALGAAALLALAALGVTGWLSLRPLVRALRGGAR